MSLFFIPRARGAGIQPNETQEWDCHVQLQSTALSLALRRTANLFWEWKPFHQTGGFLFLAQKKPERWADLMRRRLSLRSQHNSDPGDLFRHSAPSRRKLHRLQEFGSSGVTGGSFWTYTTACCITTLWICAPSIGKRYACIDKIVAQSAVNAWTQLSSTQRVNRTLRWKYKV